ncbi:MAG: GNAT family N-acetyltransferase [Candidatus Izemoplasmatales bacterium]|jgi:GNAT superfamily N-acetyltransferase
MDKWMIKEIEADQEKKEIATSVLSALPDWFGIPESTDEYIDNSKLYPMFAAFTDTRVIGFISLKPTAEKAIEIYVMGVMPAFHRQGVGKQLIIKAESFIRMNGYRLFHVKTVSPQAKYASYLKTHQFYQSLGFWDLEVLPIWDDNNPCLLMVKEVV